MMKIPRTTPSAVLKAPSSRLICTTGLGRRSSSDPPLRATTSATKTTTVTNRIVIRAEEETVMTFSPIIVAVMENGAVTKQATRATARASAPARARVGTSGAADPSTAARRRASQKTPMPAAVRAPMGSRVKVRVIVS